MILSEATLRSETFQTLYNLIDANKPVGWTVLSAYPTANPIFPCIIINSANIEFDKLVLHGGTRERIITVLVEAFAKANQGKGKIDEALDNIDNTIITNQNSLFTTYGLDFQTIDASNQDVFIENDQRINTGALIVEFKFG